MYEDLGFLRDKRMLNGAMPQTHNGRWGPVMHALEKRLMQLKVDIALRRPSAARFHDAALTGFHRPGIDHKMLLLLKLFVL